MSERAQALEQANYFLDAIDEIATIGAAPKHHTGQSAMPPPYNMTPSTAKNIKWNTREIRSKLALLASAAPPVGVSPQPNDDRRYDEMLAWRGLDRETNCICVKCAGAGVRCYSSTATWHGGVGGMTPTMAVCDKCWGSGNESQRWPSHRESPASLSPVEPTPEPPPDAQVCVWRDFPYVRTTCGATRWYPEDLRDSMVSAFNFCPYCGKRLEVGTAPQGGEQC